MEFRRSLGVIESLELLGTSGMLRSFVWVHRVSLEVCSELSDICFVIWLRYHSMLVLHDRPVLAMVNILTLELYQLFQN